MNFVLFIFLLCTLQIFYWVVGKRASKNLKTEEDYFLAGKKVRLFPLAMTFFATQVGGGLVLGSAEEAYRFGWSVLLYPLGASLGLIFLGSGIGRRLASFPVSTVAQILEFVYRSAALKKVASILSVVSLFMILVGQIIASNKFLVSLGMNNTLLFIAIWAVVIVYTTYGGLKAVISTDVVQAAFFSLVFFGCLGFALSSSPLPAINLEPMQGLSSKLCGWLFMPLLFMLIEQDMAQRCFAGISPKAVSKASLFAGVGTLVVCCIPIFFGCLAKKLGVAIPEGGSVLMAVIEKTTNPWISAVFACAILAVIISTATSLINAISSNLSSDFTVRKTSMRSVRILTAGISIGAIFSAFYFDNIVDMLIQSYELSVSCLFIPIFFALFKKKGNFASALLAILLGSLSFSLFRIYPAPIPREILSVLFSLLGYCGGETIEWVRRKSRIGMLEENR